MIKNKIILVLISLVLIFSAACVIKNTPDEPDIPYPRTEYRQSGDFNRTLQHNGMERTYVLHVPPESDKSTPVPLVLLLHGATGNADTIIDCTYVKMNEKADARGYVVAYPEGTGDTENRVFFWNGAHCCGYAWDNNVDDVGFIRELIAELVNELNLDTTRIYVSGFSNGGMMTHRLGAELSDILAAIAPISGTIGGRNNKKAEDILIPQNPLNPLPVLIMHGQLDLEIPYDGGHIVAMYGREDLSVATSVSFWLKNNLSNTTPTRSISPTGDYIKDTYLPADEATGAEVILYTLPNVAHDWAEVVGDSSATDIILDFFASHTKKQ